MKEEQLITGGKKFSMPHKNNAVYKKKPYFALFFKTFSALTWIGGGSIVTQCTVR